MIPAIANFPSLDVISDIVRRAREQLRFVAPDPVPPTLPLVLHRGTARVESPQLHWAPVEWAYVVVQSQQGDVRHTAVCIDHDHRFSAIPDVLSLTHGEQRRAAFRQIRRTHLNGVPVEEVLHFVCLRLPRAACTLLHYPQPDRLSPDDNWEADRVHVALELRDSLMSAFNLLRTDLH